MRSTLTLVTCLFACASFGQNIWIQKDSVNGPPRAACASFVLANEMYVVGGVDVEEFKRKTYSYDLDQDDWDDETELAGVSGSGLERASAVGFAAAGYGFVALGNGASANFKDLWRYDEVTESWTQMANFAGTARRGAVAFVIDDMAYVGSGEDNDGLTNDFYKYDNATNTWTEIEPLAVERKEAVGFSMGGQGYVGTGRGASSYLKDFWQYNPLTDEWVAKADFPGSPRFGAVGCGIFPNAFIMLGEDNDFEYKQDVWEYNYFGNVWTQRADYAGGTRTQANAAVVDNRIFVGLGYNGLHHDDFYEYDRILSTAELEIINRIKLFPNPTQNQFEVQLENTLSTPSLKVHATNGQEINTSFITSGNRIKTTINERIEPGIYLVSLYSEGHYIGTKQVVISL